MCSPLAARLLGTKSAAGSFGSSVEECWRDRALLEQLGGELKRRRSARRAFDPDFPAHFPSELRSDRQPKSDAAMGSCC